MPELKPTLLPIADFPIDHPEAGVMLTKLGTGQYQAMERQALFPASNSYWNVRKNIKKHGGEMKLGWLITWLPGVYISATHYGVWLSPTGRLLDVTTPPARLMPTRRQPRLGQSIFVADDSLSIDLDFPVSIEERHTVLVDDPLVEDYLANYRINNQAFADFTSAIRHDGNHTWTPDNGFNGLEPFSATALSHTGRLNESYRKMEQGRQSIMRKYFPTLKQPG